MGLPLDDGKTVSPKLYPAQTGTVYIQPQPPQPQQPELGPDYIKRLAAYGKTPEGEQALKQAQPQPQRTVIIPGGIRAIIRQEQQMEHEALIREQERSIGWTPEHVSRLFEQSQQKEDFWQGVKRTWSEPGLRPENILSEFVFRKWWDPAYKASIEAEYKEWTAKQGGIEEVWKIRQAQSRQVEFGVSAALIGYTAFDIARSAYTIIKYRALVREPMVVEVPEVQTEKFSVVSMTGPKGDRIAEFTDIKVPERPIAEGFKIEPIRGTPTTPMKTTLEHALAKDTRGSLLLPSLVEPFTALPTLTSVKVPFANYQPFLITQVAVSGMALGKITSFLVPPSLKSEWTVPKISAPQRQPEFTLPKAYQPLKPFSLPTFKDVLDVDVTPQATTEAAQSQKQAQATIQRQAQQVIQKQRLEYPKYPTLLTMRMGKKGKKGLFDLSDRVRRYYPIKKAKELFT